MKRLRILPFVAFVLCAPLLAANFAIEAIDPQGDDNVSENLRSAELKQIEPGELDLISVSAQRKSNETMFKVTFAQPIARPDVRAISEGGTTLADEAPFGFYKFHLHVQVDSADRDLDATPLTICVKPDRYSLTRLSDADEKRPVISPTAIRVSGRDIVFVIPVALLGSIENARIFAAVSPSDLLFRLDSGVYPTSLNQPESEDAYKELFWPIIDVVVPAGYPEKEFLSNLGANVDSSH